MRLIDADVLITNYNLHIVIGAGDNICIDIADIAKAPAVEAVEVVHGHWTATDVIVHKAGYGVRYYYHAECKVNPHRLFECENDYCPNCGAKMDGGTDNV